MKVIIEDLNCKEYNLELTKEQVEFAKWLYDKDILYKLQVIDKMEWEDIK